MDVKVFQNWVLMEHEVMGPKLTQAEGFILGVGAKMFTRAGPVIVYLRTPQERCPYDKRLDQIGQAFLLY